MRGIIALLISILACQAAAGRVWRVEKDGSGDFTVIQDALDATAPGDTVIVGPGRFEDFRLGQSTVDGFEFQMIAWIYVDNITLIGSGSGTTLLGPEVFADEVDGLPAGCLYVDAGTRAWVSGFTIENTLGRVTLRRRTELAECAISKEDSNAFFAVSIGEGDSTLIRDCEFSGSSSIITSSSSVTNSQVIGCTFDNLALDGTAIVIGNGATGSLVSGCTITGYAVGIQTSLGGTATIEESHFLSVRITAIDLSSGSIVLRRCWIDDGNRFPVFVAQGTIEIYNSHIGGGTVATIVRSGSGGLYVKNSNILNGGALTIDARGTAAVQSDLRYNWWGTTDLQQIDSWISQPDDEVLYVPILDSSVSTKVESLSSLKARFAPEKP